MSFVLDASAAVDVLLQNDNGMRLMAAVRGQALFVPDFFHAEVMSALKSLFRGHAHHHATAAALIADLALWPLRTESSRNLLAQAWPLSTSLGSYDSFYVALAQQRRCPLITTDRKLARGAQSHVAVLSF